MLKEKVKAPQTTLLRWLLIPLFIVIASCDQESSEPSEPPPFQEIERIEVPEEPVTVNFVIRQEGQLGAFKALANQFERQNPTITIEVDHQRIEESALNLSLIHI